MKCASFDKPEEEAEAVATNIEKLVRQESVPPREIAVFYRTNDMSRLIEQSLAKRQMPYQVVGSGSYYDRMEVKDVLSMLRFVCNPQDGISFHRIANKPARGMGDALVGRLEAFAERHDLDLLDRDAPSRRTSATSTASRCRDAALRALPRDAAQCSTFRLGGQERRARSPTSCSTARVRRVAQGPLRGQGRVRGPPARTSTSW